MTSKLLMQRSRITDSLMRLQINKGSFHKIFYSMICPSIKEQGVKEHLFKSPRSVYRESSTAFEKPEQLIVKSYGDPQDVVIKETFTLPEHLKDNQVLVKVLASPVNPADINTIQGVYAIKPEFPFVPGNEAVMEVVSTGSSVTGLQVGDRVIPNLNAMGTWRTSLLATEDELIKVPRDIDLVSASTIAVNPCTAFRMLTDFVDLKAGDVVIQNCSNSAVGQAAIQIAKAKEIQTVNIVRDRPNFEELESHLLSLGATLVIKDIDLRTKRGILSELPKPRLALNGVSGKAGTDILRQLAAGGTMVTYGGMSRMPLTVPVASLIFTDVIIRGFWMTRWNQQHKSDPERKAMFDYLFDLTRNGSLTPPPHDLVPFEQYLRALDQAMPSQGMVGKKQILIFI